MTAHREKQFSSNMPNAEYWCFISYRHADNRASGRQWATWLHQQIETYEVPADLVGKTNDRGDVFPERIFPVFRDEDELPADADLAAPIYRALERSKFLIVLCSPQAAASDYVADEVRYFKQIGKAGRVLAVLIEGEPNASRNSRKNQTDIDSARECFPKPLLHPVDPTGKIIETERTEPIAADFRLMDGKQGWTTPEAYRQSLRGNDNLTDREIDQQVAEYCKRAELAKLKIIAGILGVPLGYLTQRDKAYQLEKARRRARILWRVSLVMIVLAALALFASVYALKREKDARLAKATSDDLSEFMIVDLYQRLIRIGRTDLLDETAGRLDRLLGSGPVPHDKTDCVRYLRLKTQVAKIRLAQGRITDAYQICTETLSSVPKQLNSDVDVSLAIAGLQSFASDIAIRIGAPDGELLANQAVETFRKYKQLEPLSQALLNRIDYHTQRQDFTTARTLANESSLIAERAVQESSSHEARETLLRILLRQARLEFEAGNIPRAIAVLSERSARLASYAAHDPDHWLWDREKILNDIEESKYQLRLSNNERALTLAELSLREALILDSRDSGNLEWNRIAATAYNHRAFVLLALERSQEAIADFELGLSRFQKITQFSPRNLGWRSSLAWTHDGMRSALIATDSMAALRHSSTAVDLLRSVHQELGKPNMSDAARELMMAITSKANLQTDLLELDDAALTIAEAVELSKTLGPTDALLCSDTYFTQSEIHAARNQLTAAIDSARKGRDFILKVENLGRSIALAHMKVAILEAENAMTNEARESATAAVTILEDIHVVSPSAQSTRDLETVRTFLLNLPQ